MDEKIEISQKEFESKMSRLKFLKENASYLWSEYYTGYMRGLRRLKHGENFGTEEEHKKYMSLEDEKYDESRVYLGRGYRDGLINKEVCFYD